MGKAHTVGYSKHAQAFLACAGNACVKNNL